MTALRAPRRAKRYTVGVVRDRESKSRVRRKTSVLIVLLFVVVSTASTVLKHPAQSWQFLYAALHTHAPSEANPLVMDIRDAHPPVP